MSDDKVVPLHLSTAAQARMEAQRHMDIADDGLETFLSIEFFKGKPPEITHNTASTERLLYAAEVIRQYALGHIRSQKS